MMVNSKNICFFNTKGLETSKWSLNVFNRFKLGLSLFPSKILNAFFGIQMNERISLLKSFKILAFFAYLISSVSIAGVKLNPSQIRDLIQKSTGIVEVVYINSNNEFFLTCGTATFYDSSNKRRFLTAYHVVQQTLPKKVVKGGPWRREAIFVSFPNSSPEFGTIKAGIESTPWSTRGYPKWSLDSDDLVSLRLEKSGPPSLKTLPLGDVIPSSQKSEVWAGGYPKCGETDPENNIWPKFYISKGHLLGFKKEKNSKIASLKHSAYLLNGMSGGPLVASNGTAIGMNISTLTDKKPSGRRFVTSIAVSGQMLIGLTQAKPTQIIAMVPPSKSGIPPLPPPLPSFGSQEDDERVIIDYKKPSEWSQPIEDVQIPDPSEQFGEEISDDSGPDDGGTSGTHTILYESPASHNHPDLAPDFAEKPFENPGDHYDSVFISPVSLNGPSLVFVQCGNLPTGSKVVWAINTFSEVNGGLESGVAYWDSPESLLPPTTPIVTGQYRKTGEFSCPIMEKIVLDADSISIDVDVKIPCHSTQSHTHEFKGRLTGQRHCETIQPIKKAFVNNLNQSKVIICAGGGEPVYGGKDTLSSLRTVGCAITPPPSEDPWMVPTLPHVSSPLTFPEVNAIAESSLGRQDKQFEKILIEALPLLIK